MLRTRCGWVHPRSQPRLLLDTPEHGQVRGIFHNSLFGKHPAEDGKFGRVGHSWIRTEQLLGQFFRFAKHWDFSPNCLQAPISISVFRRDELMGQEMVNLLLVIRKAGPLPASPAFYICPQRGRTLSRLTWCPRCLCPPHQCGCQDACRARGIALLSVPGGCFGVEVPTTPLFLLLCLLWSCVVLERFHGWWCWNKLPGYKQLRSVFITHLPHLNFGPCSSLADWGNTKLSYLFQFAGWFTTKSLAFPTTNFCITSNDSCIPEQWLVVCRNSWCWIVSWIILLCSVMRKEGFFPPYVQLLSEMLGKKKKACSV